MMIPLVIKKLILLLLFTSQFFVYSNFSHDSLMEMWYCEFGNKEAFKLKYFIKLSFRASHTHPLEPMNY